MSIAAQPIEPAVPPMQKLRERLLLAVAEFNDATGAKVDNIAVEWCSPLTFNSSSARVSAVTITTKNT